MTHGGDSHRIRIRVTADDPHDLGALHRWLSLEEWFTRAQAAHGLTVVYREGDGTEHEAHPAGPPMSSGMVELVLVIAGAALPPAFQDLYERAKVAVSAWADNIGRDGRRVEAEVRADSHPGADAVARSDAGPVAAADADTEDGEGGRPR